MYNRRLLRCTQGAVGIPQAGPVLRFVTVPNVALLIHVV